MAARLLTGCGGGQLYTLQQTERAANPNANNSQKFQHVANVRGSLNVTGRQDSKFQTKTCVFPRYSVLLCTLLFPGYYCSFCCLPCVAALVAVVATPFCVVLIAVVAATHVFGS